MQKIKVVVNGAGGNMGQEVIRAVAAEDEFSLVGAVDLSHHGADVGVIAGISELGIKISDGLDKFLSENDVDVVIDFTSPTIIMNNIETILKHKVRPVVGTTGLTEADLVYVEKWVAKAGVGCFIAPNFAIGAVLMMVLAAKAAPYMDSVEIIELHHDQKIDAPSGTAIKTAEMIAKSTGNEEKKHKKNEFEKITGARGGTYKGINIHSVRLPGLVAHQEVILGGMGQTLTLRHDSLNRKSFMPGVIMAVKNIVKETKLIYGLENIVDL